MLSRRRHREVPELNTTSTADISFMLLVFFLVTSSMDADKGMGRMLPPVDDQQEQRDISRSDILQLSIDASDAMFCDQQAVSADELRQRVESFVAAHPTNSYLIAVAADRHSSYQAYFTMQDAVAGAYRTLRDKMAQQRYGHPFAQCSTAERGAIMARYPQRISEGYVVEEGGRP